ncbi:NUDIX hydrolase [Aggregatilineales bacterium SYSU G02658]
MNEQSNDKQVIYNGRVIHVELHEVTLANGNRAKRELVRHPGAVAVVPLEPDGQVVLVEQFRFAAGRVLLEIPAGTLEAGEDPDQCAERELREETGLRPGRLDKLGGIYVAPGYTTEFIHLYLARELTPDPLAMDADEDIHVVRLPLAAALAKVDAGEIIDGKTVSALLRVARRLGV